MTKCILKHFFGCYRQKWQIAVICPLPDQQLCLFTEKPVVMIMVQARRINFLMIILLKNWISIFFQEAKIKIFLKWNFFWVWKIEKVFVVHLLVSLYPILYGRQSWKTWKTFLGHVLQSQSCWVLNIGTIFTAGAAKLEPLIVSTH